MLQINPIQRPAQHEESHFLFSHQRGQGEDGDGRDCSHSPHPADGPVAGQKEEGVQKVLLVGKQFRLPLQGFGGVAVLGEFLEELLGITPLEAPLQGRF